MSHFIVGSKILLSVLKQVLNLSDLQYLYLWTQLTVPVLWDSMRLTEAKKDIAQP